MTGLASHRVEKTNLFASMQGNRDKQHQTKVDSSPYLF